MSKSEHYRLHQTQEYQEWLALQEPEDTEDDWIAYAPNPYGIGDRTRHDPATWFEGQRFYFTRTEEA